MSFATATHQSTGGLRQPAFNRTVPPRRAQGPTIGHDPPFAKMHAICLDLCKDRAWKDEVRILLIRFVTYFVTLAHERHFARAAEICGVSQPTLSAGLVSLEKELGKRLIMRDRRFVALTPEGEAALPWAQQMLATRDALTLAVETPGGVLHGELRLGIIPAALPVGGYIVDAILELQPEITVAIRSLTSREIAHGLSASELDAGITYLDHERLPSAHGVPLYQETYMFLRRAQGATRAVRKGIDLADALKQPLCALHQGMQNRRILDQRLADRGLSLNPRAITDSYVALLAMVHAGHFATIIPDSYAALLSGLEWAQLLPFDNPLPSSRIGLTVPNHGLLGAMANTAMAAARQIQLPTAFRTF
jgi:DNA-binding transcriptional LysR family regulator